MNHQREAFINGLGDHWFTCNKDDLGKIAIDPVQKLVEQFKLIGPESHVLEVGCSNGWRLKKLAEKYGCLIFGVDPSKGAIEAAGHDGFRIGTADALPFGDNSMGCIIMGFVMWSLDPSDWLKAVAETDRVLMNGGIIIIHDRLAARAVRRVYSEDGADSVYGYCYDWKKLWLGHPGYQEIAEAYGVYPGTATVEGATLLRKSYDHSMLHCSEPEEVKND